MEVIITINTLILKPKLNDEKMLGIIKKIINGLAAPPVKYNRNVNCNISMIKNINADLLKAEFFYKYILKINYLVFLPI